MALVFTGGDGDNVNFGSGASLDGLTAHTAMVWLYFGATGAPTRTIFAKGSFAPDNDRNPSCYITSEAATVGISVDRATSDAYASSNETLTASVWNFVAFTYDESDGPRAFLGNLTTIAAEVTYASRAVGVGNSTDPATKNVYVGGEGGSTSINGRIATVAFFNRRMVLAEIQSHQFRPRVANGCVLFSHLGFAGTGTQPDWSGNGNSGAVTGAVVADHVPLGPPFGFDVGLPYAVAAAANAMPMAMNHYRRLRIA